MATLQGVGLTSGWMTLEGEDAVVFVRATPGARQPGFDGIIEGPHGRPVLKVKVRARAEDGAANAELLAYLAKALGRPRSSVSLESGMSARFKTIPIAGGGAEAAARMKELIGP